MAHIETKFEAWKNQVVGEVQRFMNLEIPRHLKEISDEVDLLRSSSLPACTQVDDLQKSRQFMQSRLTMPTKHGVFPTFVEDAPLGGKSKMARRQSKSSVNRNSKNRHTDDTDSSSTKEEYIESGSSSDSDVEARRTRSSSHSNGKTKSRARDVRSLDWTSWYLPLPSSRKSCRTRRIAWITKTRVKMRTFANVCASFSVFSMC